MPDNNTPVAAISPRAKPSKPDAEQLLSDTIGESTSILEGVRNKLKGACSDLSEADYQVLVRIAGKRGLFMDEFIRSAIANPLYLPGYADKEKVSHLAQKFKDFTPVISLADEISHILRSEALQSGDELYKIAVVYMAALKAAAKQGNVEAQAIYNRLAAVRPKTHLKKSKADAPPASPDQSS
jgi:hypothetical protein